tara:strand:- start:2431 stop:2733 length:303 start_codon:yes stop_codon:yes gene_type:complete
MPSSKKYDDYVQDDVYEYETEDTYVADIDEDGNPFINGDFFDLYATCEHRDWINQSHDDIVNMYSMLKSYIQDEASSQICEKLTFNKFMLFISRCSYQKS